MEALRAAADEVSTSSTKRRLLLFRESLPPLLKTSGNIRRSGLHFFVSELSKTQNPRSNRPIQASFKSKTCCTMNRADSSQSLGMRPDRTPRGSDVLPLSDKLSITQPKIFSFPQYGFKLG